MYKSLHGVLLFLTLRIIQAIDSTSWRVFHFVIDKLYDSSIFYLPRELFFFVSKHFLKLLRWHLDSFWTWYQIERWFPGKENYAQDGRWVGENIHLCEESYGPHHRQTVHILTPLHVVESCPKLAQRSEEEERGAGIGITDQETRELGDRGLQPRTPVPSCSAPSLSAVLASRFLPARSPSQSPSVPSLSLASFGLGTIKKRKRLVQFKGEIPSDMKVEVADPSDLTNIVFIHGGGWVAANSTVLLHSITPLCRKGYRIFSLNYPMSPEDPFPAALVSVLSGLHYIKSKHGVQTVCLLGDSAGSNLATMAAALVQNPHLLKELAKEVEEPINYWSYPKVSSLVSLYGLLDQHSWKQRLPAITILENIIMVCVLCFCLNCYKRPVFGGRVTLVDIKNDLHNFPKTFLVGANQDPLVHSSRYTYKILTERGFHCEMMCYDARHGFFGLPPAWTFGSWKKNAAPALVDIQRFLESHHSNH